MVRTAEVIKRMPCLWQFILLNGLLYLGLGAAYLVMPDPDYLLLSRIIIVLIIVNGFGELAFYRRKHHTLDGSRLPAFLFEFVIGTVLLLLPLFSIVVFPVFLAACLMLRAITDLSLLKRGLEVQVAAAAPLRKFAWAKLVIGIFTFIYLGVNTKDIWFVGVPFAAAGVLSVVYAIRLRQLKFD